MSDMREHTLPIATRANAWTRALAIQLLLALHAISSSAANATPAPNDGTPPAAAASAASTAAPTWVHAYAAFGQPKYAKDFQHFEYVNPDAPKGGTLNLANPDRRTSFDKFNYFTIKGNAPAGMAIFMLETLAAQSSDEPLTMYGLLADQMSVAPDKSSITFHLNPKARFSNGDPVLSADVKYSFDSISGKYASPTYATTFAGVKQAVVIDERTIRFDSADNSTDTLFKLGALPVFSHKYGMKPDGTHARFDEIVSEYPLTSGPYTIASADSGRHLEFKRNPAYWAKDLPVRRGFYNFDRVVYRYYKDEDVAIEAFKAGEYDILKIYSAPIWERQLKGAKYEDGRIIKQSFPTGTGQGLQAYELNLRRPIFQDIRVRQALNLSFDFETTNRYHRFKRANSVFNNSDLASQGLPSAGELALLEPYRSILPKEVFGPAYVAPKNDIDPNALRRNLLKARSLLEEAGWKIAPDGVLRNAKGEPFVFEYLAPSSQDTDRRMSSWRRNLDKLGIVIRDRKVDFALYSRRLEEYDLDMITIVEGTFTLPSPSDYASLYGSKSADEKGNNNFRGVKNAAADHALEAMSKASTMEAFTDACRALDRIVMWSYWQVPELYLAFEDATYWNKFEMPKVRPKYFTIDAPFDVDTQLAWPLAAWWFKDAAKR
jgi:microcin C transport system substrate-binding protein